MKNIVWLASYPKSGNTWIRLLLANYLARRDTPVPLSELPKFALGDALATLHAGQMGSAPNLLDEQAVLRARTPMLQQLTANGKVHVLKTHNINQPVGGVPMIPAQLTRAAIYVLRNPLDLVISYGAHYGQDVATAVKAIASKTNQVLEGDGNVRQYLGRWSDHVKSWATERRYPVLVLRYEDLLEDTGACFTRVLERIGLPPDPSRVAHAVEMSRFDKAQAQEQAEGFSEKSAKAERFFRTGQAGQWQDTLASELVEQVRKDHSKTMKKFGYLP